MADSSTFFTSSGAFLVTEIQNVERLRDRLAAHQIGDESRFLSGDPQTFCNCRGFHHFAP